MTQIQDVPINTIASNPYRRLHAYPYIQSKLDALQRSIADVGLWPSVIARPIPQEGLWRYEQAFGHHRIEAARRAELQTIPIIVADLSDQQMLQYMGRENLEDYNANFLIQLESWEAAVKSGLVASGRPENGTQAIDIARLLGWTRLQGGKTQILNDTASACHAAYVLINGGHLTREDLTGSSVEGVRLVVERALSRMEQLERIMKTQQQPRRDIDEAKRHIATGAKETARQYREGKITKDAVRGQVDVNSYRHAREAKKQSPLFAKFAKDAADSIERLLQKDTLAEKMAEIQKNLELLTLDDDRQALKRLDYELEALADRAGIWRKRLTPVDKKVSHLQVS
jgi:hypothetical protein